MHFITKKVKKTDQSHLLQNTIKHCTLYDMKKAKHRTTRLFLFAGYDKNGIIDDALTYYVRSISQFGDIVLCMDSQCSDDELSKLAPYVKHAMATRHGEYDFGSYKRAYIWATQNLNLSDYDFVYILNDSVFGPLYPMDKYFNDMESAGTDVFGLCYNPTGRRPHIQSWFIGMRPTVFLSKWFNEFMHAVTHQSDKGAITYLYEYGFTKQAIDNGFTTSHLFETPGRSVYNGIRKLYRRKMPFMKKVAFNRNNGALGRQIKQVLSKFDPTLRDAILSSARATYSDKHIDWLLTSNPIKITYRHIQHILRKIFIEGI